LPPAAVISFYQFVQLVLIARGDGNRRARSGELQRAGSSYALRRALTNATRPERDMRFLQINSILD